MSIKFWDCLPSSTLLGLTVTVITCLIALSIYARAKHNPIANLVLIAVTIVVAALKITRTPYRTYSDGAQFLHFLLGPATVALPLRLWRSCDKFKGGTPSPLCGLAAGSLTAVLVISTGVFGAATARWVLNIVRLTRLPGTRAW